MPLATRRLGDHFRYVASQDATHVRVNGASVATLDRGQAFDQILKLLGLEGRLHHKPRALSGGEQQRVAIARAIVNRPAILLADEPTGNLDTENSQAVLGVLRDLNTRLGQTILMITHNPEAAAYGHRIVKMLDGRIVE